MSSESQQTAALIAAKDDLLSAYKNVHHSLGRLINLVHGSDPSAIADALSPQLDFIARSPPQTQYSSNHSRQASCASRSSRFPDPLKSYHQTPFYPAPPQPQAQSTATTTTTTTTTSNQIKSSHDSSNSNPTFLNPISHSHQNLAYSNKPSKQIKPSPHHSFNPQTMESIETEEEEDDDDEEDEDEEEPVSDDERNQSSLSSFYPTCHYPPNIGPTPPESTSGVKKRERKTKRERDPNAPKRPASAYILFQNAVRQEMRAANPTADYKELARQIGDRWKSLSEEAKRPWSEAGKLAMNSWNIQNREYKTAHPDAVSPQTYSTTSSAGLPPAGVRKKRSKPRSPEFDDQGHPLRKKRGRPSKTEKDHIFDHQVISNQSGLPSAGNPLQPSLSNGHHPIPPPPTSINISNHQSHFNQHDPNALNQSIGQVLSEEDDDDDEDEEDESLEENSKISLPIQSVNGTFQPTLTNVDVGQSEEDDEEDLDDDEDDDDDDHDNNHHLAINTHHVSKKFRIEPSPITA